jgi:ferritin
MISQPVLDKLNEQITHELYSAYFYLSMSAHCELANLPGFASWLRVQAGEEQGHAMKIYDFILDRGGKVTLQAIPQPPVDFTTPQAIFEQVYAHEQKVTGLINNLYSVAVAGKDTASQVFLHWFITEQVEEERNASQILDMLNKVGTSVGGLYQLDHRLGKRSGES